MRHTVFACALALPVVGCGEATMTGGAASIAMIDCSLNGAGGFARDCSMERMEQDGDSFVIVRHPDGAFRRFALGVPGRGLVTADGAQQAEITQRGDYVEVRVDSDRYHLPVAE